jgi:hypothetical protein
VELCDSRSWASQQPREQGGPLKEMHPIAPRRRPNPSCFMHLYRRVLARSRPTESPKANQFLAHLALLVGPEALSRPATAQKSLGRGAVPPPGAAARHLEPQTNLRLRWKMEGSCSPRRTDRTPNFAKNCNFRISYRFPPPPPVLSVVARSLSGALTGRTADKNSGQLELTDWRWTGMKDLRFRTGTLRLFGPAFSSTHSQPTNMALRKSQTFGECLVSEPSAAS